MNTAFTRGLLKEAFDFSDMWEQGKKKLKSMFDHGPGVFNPKATGENNSFTSNLRQNTNKGTNSFAFLGLDNPDIRTSFTGTDLGTGVRRSPPPGPNSLLIESHGSGPPGGYKLETEPRSLVGHRMPTEGTVEDVAKKIGPATNNIHNIRMHACNPGGGCTPEYLRTLFPNVTNIVQQPVGTFGPIFPKQIDPSVIPPSPGQNAGFFGAPLSGLRPSQGHEAQQGWLNNANKLMDENDRLTRWSGLPSRKPMTWPHQYNLQGGQWLDKGENYE